MTPTIYYHGGCLDGMTAAYAAWNHFQGKGSYHPFVYGKRDLPLPSNGPVYFLDCCPPTELVHQLVHEGTLQVTIIDHHQTATPTLENLRRAYQESECKVEILFDLNRSGAGLAWDYFQGPGNRHELVDLVEDRDLWRFSLSSTQAINDYLESLPMDFPTWDATFRRWDSSKPGILYEGTAIGRMKGRQVEKAVARAYFEKVNRYKVPHVNASHFHSEIGHALLAKYPGADFAVVWFTNQDQERVYSLRSEDRRRNVGNIALLYGGGGHRNAAGFVLPPQDNQQEASPLENALKRIADQAREVTAKQRPQASFHEGYGLLQEEVLELLLAIQANDSEAARQEAVDLAVVAARIIATAPPLRGKG